jgi:type IV pilus assembly protein PilC
MIYRYQATKEDRLVAAGTIEAASAENAEEALYQSGFKYVLNLRAAKTRASLHEAVPTLFGMKIADVIDFSRQLAAFLESGSSLHTSLDMLSEQAAKPAVKAVLRGINERLEQGLSFSDAVREYPQVFPDSYWQVIQSGEKTGELGNGLRQIADYLENRAKIADKIKRALAYPVFVICLGIGVIVLMVTTVLPPILKLFASYNTPLPPTTMIAISLLHFFTAYKLYLLLGVLLIILGGLLFARTAGGKLIIDRLMLRLPLIGPFVSAHNLGIFCRTSSMLIKAGLPLPEVMDVAIQSGGRNRVINKTLTTLKHRLMQGEGLAQPMAEDKVFPAMMVRMTAVGEQTGTLESSLATLASFYEEKAHKRIQSLVGMIEPALTIAIGLGIAFVMYSMIIPIYSIVKTLH